MFRTKRNQGSLFSAATLLTEEKRQRLERTWAWAFRTRALPLIDEEAFRHLYDKEGNGRPNKPVQTLVGLLVLKEMFDLTDDEVLFNLDFNLAYHVALALEPEEAHACQKTLHNFRTKLIETETDALLFVSLTDRMIAALGVDIGKQRLDSTHIVSNIARLTRLGLFCETIRVFLYELKKEFPAEFDGVGEALRRRYLKEDGTATRFGDAASKETRRRLSVCARDVWRLVDRFRGTTDVSLLEKYQLLERLLKDQCNVVAIAVAGSDGDADVAEPGVPVEVKEPKEVLSNSLQTPHDPDVTYSGHKGKGYEVQIAETYSNENSPEIITHVEVTRSCDSDEQATVPTVEALAEREIQPDELVADTTYGSTANAIACDKMGTELVSPTAGAEAGAAKDQEIRKEQFLVDPSGEKKAMCPEHREAVREERDDAHGVIRAYFDAKKCADCPHRNHCPTRPLKDGTRVLQTTQHRAVLTNRRIYEQTDEFKKRYAQRAGIEATNSELKRKHGLGRIRTRRFRRIRLAVYLKVVACNVKRMVKHVVKMACDAGRTAEMAIEAANGGLAAC
jgi:hypothetical protein